MSKNPKVYSFSDDSGENMHCCIDYGDGRWAKLEIPLSDEEKEAFNKDVSIGSGEACRKELHYLLDNRILEKATYSGWSESPVPYVDEGNNRITLLLSLPSEGHPNTNEAYEEVRNTFINVLHSAIVLSNGILANRPNVGPCSP